MSQTSLHPVRTQFQVSIGFDLARRSRIIQSTNKLRTQHLDLLANGRKHTSPASRGFRLLFLRDRKCNKTQTEENQPKIC